MVVLQYLLKELYVQFLNDAQKFISFIYLQWLQVAFLWITQQGWNAMIVPHASNIGVPPQWENLTNDCHPPQRAVNQLHYICIAHLLKMNITETFYFHVASVEIVTTLSLKMSAWDCCTVSGHEEIWVGNRRSWRMLAVLSSSAARIWNAAQEWWVHEWAGKIVQLVEISTW